MGALTVILFLTISLILYVPGMLKFVLLCDIFTKHKSDLSRDERQEIIQHCRKRCEMHSPSNKANSNKIIYFFVSVSKIVACSTKPCSYK